MCPRAAEATSGTAWTRSVPTSSLALRVGYRAISAMMMSEPEPTEVKPTTMPPTTPTMTVGTIRRVDRGPALRQRRGRDRHDGERARRAGGRPRTIRPAAETSRAMPRAVRMASAPPRRCRATRADQHAAEGAGDGAEAEPLDQAEVYGAATQVDDRADRLHHRARHEVGGDRGQRRDIEEEHEHRRHQRAAAHAGETDDDADTERRRPREESRSSRRDDARSTFHSGAPQDFTR